MTLDSNTTAPPAPPKPAAQPQIGGEVADCVDSSAISGGDAPISGPAISANANPSASNRSWKRRILSSWDSQRTPAFLISLILHTLLFLTLALVGFRGSLELVRDIDSLTLDVDSLQQNSESTLMVFAAESEPAPPMPVELPIQPPTNSIQPSEIELQELLAVDPAQQAAVVKLSQLQQILNASSAPLAATFSSTGVEGRQPDRRRELAMSRGGTLQSEQAVEAALEWLAAHQLPNGGWSLVHDGGRCNGQCRNNGAKDRFDPAATGLSLLAFMGAGYTHKDGKHRETVKNGIYFLQQILEETPQGGSYLYQCERGMYNHGIASFAICEAYQLTHDPDLKKPCQQVVNFILHAQNYQGGWGYLPKQPGDLTLSGWQIMALKSAFAAGIEVPSENLERVSHFLDTQMAETKVTYGYSKPGDSPTSTAIGILVRLFLGVTHTDPNIIDGCRLIAQHDDLGTDVYLDYYTTLTLFHFGGSLFEAWNERTREHLIRTQATQGHEAGSWYFDNPYGKEGGRLYTTAMAAMTLEVYYRFAPLYLQSDVSFEL